MKLKSNKSFLFFPILIAASIYLVILITLNFIYINNSKILRNDEVIIEWIELEKKVTAQKLLQVNVRETKPSIPKEEKIKPPITAPDKFKESEILDVIIDSTLINESDSVKIKSSWLDSLVVANPSLDVLKYAASKFLKNNPIVKTDSALVAEGIRSFMQDYYKSKYPTPVYKFGNTPQGIAIEDIINVFKTDDIDEEKIKKYLKID